MEDVLETLGRGGEGSEGGAAVSEGEEISRRWSCP